MRSSPRFRLKELAGLCRRVGTGLEAGVDAKKSWGREAERASPRHRATLNHVVDEINQGSSMPLALRGTDGAFPPLMHDLIKIGEQTGKFDQVLLRLAEHFDHMLDLRRIFLAGIIWPAIQLFMAIGVIGLLILIMGYIPQDPNQPFDLVGFGLRGPQGLAIYLMFVAAIFFLLAMLIENWRRGRWGTQIIWPLLHKVPMLGNCIQTMALGRMAWTMSLTSNTPMDVVTGVKSCLRSTGDPVYQGLQKQIVQELMDGQPIHLALRKTEAFPAEFLDALEVGEESGRVSESLHHLSVQYEQRAKSAAKTLTVFGSMLVWGFVACIIIFFIFRMALMYTGLIEEMSQPGWK